MMHETVPNAAAIAREAKGLTQSLKESLKNHEPWDREIEFQRANLRRQYLQLIFVHPYAKESKDADHSLWMTTSYYNIAAYKQRIAAADAVVHQSTNDHAHNRGHHPRDGHHGKPSGVVEHRKLVHRFRQFLAEEEKFWTSFVLRVARVFNLEEARSAIAALGIPVSETVASEGESTRSDRRNIFPSEDATAPPSANQKEQKLIMLSKALVCLGDIARYREHYNEGGGRPRAGKDFHDDAKTTSRGRGGRRGAAEQPPRPRNYSKAQDCYERARLLVPDVGNASHQLAILANYQQDPFVSVLQYYRAMCVKHPYETAAANLDSTLSRNLEGYKSALAKLESVSNENSQPPKLRVERFKKSLVALHGLWKMEPADANKTLPGHADFVKDNFSILVAERVLPTDIIYKTLVLALGALWRFRVVREPTVKRDAKRALVTEAHIFEHILVIIHSLLHIGTVQLTDASMSPEPSLNGTPVAAGELQADLAQNITAVFRRTLPALRIGSKWLTVHFGYVNEASSRLSTDTSLDIASLLSEFWASYAAFAALLAKVFPMERLPKMTLPLEEDVEVSGFAPLKRAMFDPSMSTADGLEPGQTQVHPNEEQLMRIADLLQDAKKLSDFPDSPVRNLSGGIIPANAATSHSESSHPHSYQGRMEPTPFALESERFTPVVADADIDVQSEGDDDGATVSTRTDDDPVNLAMAAVLPSDDDDDDGEQVLYPKQNIVQPAASLSTHNAFSHPSASNANAFNSTPSTRSQPLSSTNSKPLTAEDLVNDMMRHRGASSSSIDPGPVAPLSRVLPTSASHPPPLPGSPARMLPPASPSHVLPTSSGSPSRILPLPGSPLLPPLLFGSGSPNGPTSIWSTTTQESVAVGAGGVGTNGSFRVPRYPRVSPPAAPGMQSMPAAAPAIQPIPAQGIQSMSPQGIQSIPHTSGLMQSVPSSTGIGPMTSSRGVYTHQRQLSQPLSQSPWGNLGQGSHFPIVQPSTQPRHSSSFSPSAATFSPSVVRFTSQQPGAHPRGFGTVLPQPQQQQQQQQQPQQQQQQQQQQGLFPSAAQIPFSPINIPMNAPPMQKHAQVQPGFPTQNQMCPPSQNTWSYTGADSLTGLGAPLGPFNSDLSRVHQRPGTWTPS